MYQISQSTRTELLVVDADTHLSEPWDLWTADAPATYVSRVPHVEELADGRMVWLCDGEELGPAAAMTVVDIDNKKQPGIEYLYTKQVHEVSPAASTVGPRLQVMDSQGVWAQIIYPNSVGFGGQQIGKIKDTELRTICVKIFNDRMAQLQRDSGDRLFPMAVIPWWDVKESVAEVERAHGLGLRGVNTTSDPQEFGMQDLSTSAWTPLFEAMEGLEMPLNFHIGASATQMNYAGTAPWPTRNAGEKLAIGSSFVALANGRVVANMIVGGVLERHPELKMVSVESGVGWLPFFLQSLDYTLGEMAPEDAGVHLSLKPSEYFRRQCAACFWFENELLVPSIEYLGVDNCMFESDFPHPTCLYPGPVEKAMAVFAEEPEETRRLVFGGNAVRIYNLPAPAAAQ